MSELIISVSGLRGIVGESLTPEIAARYARAFAEELPAGSVVVTRDGRASGPLLSEAIVAALSAAGRTVLNADVAATPTTGVLVRQHRAAGGIQITASHNPAEYNGMKLFTHQGRVIPAAAGQRVLDRYRAMERGTPSDAETAAAGSTGVLLSSKAMLNEHVRLIVAIVDVPRIQARRFRVLLDANHGAGGALGGHLLRHLGCQVTMLGENPDGQFLHTPEPTAENLATILPRVKGARADIGFCLDPDADRLAIIDESGRYLGEEYTLAICIDHVLRSASQQQANLAGEAIVTNCATSRMSDDLAWKYGVRMVRTAVGEAHVVDAMLEHHAVIGGEGNGGVIDGRVGLVRDSFTAMALVLDAMAARELPISEIAGKFPRYAIVKTKISLAADQVPRALDALERHFFDAKADRLDGLRLDWPDKWLLVRASNTEPIVRAIAEAPSEAAARKLCTDAARVIRA